ncbi:MAG: hypothetical protein PHW32_04805 [Bacilli bacterium]|nr:hypothetical protein [Bacilli bacterium]MDD4718697.1 hypothetical protein [Bacilli bacterium]
MLKGKQFINNLSSVQKTACLVFLLVIVLLLTLVAPTLSRYKNRNTLSKVSIWDGSVATGYRKGKGTVEKPYIISNGSELAYFQEQLSETDYENIYFELSHDILINDGIFIYDIDYGIQYIKNDITYYVLSSSNEYYDNIDRTGEPVGTLNVLEPLDGFKGQINGGSFTIYGLYINNESNDKAALFTNLEGNVSDLYLDNTMVYGGVVTAGIASNTNDLTLKNIMFDGFVIGRNTNLTHELTINPVVEPFNLDVGLTIGYIELDHNLPMIGNQNVTASISGDYLINGDSEFDGTITINGEPISGGSFHVDLGSDIVDTVPVFIYTDLDEDFVFTFSNLTYDVVYDYGISGGVVACANDTTLENVVNNAFVYGYGVSGGLVGVSTNNFNIKQSYNAGNVNSDYISGGLVGAIESKDKSVTIDKSYNDGNILATTSGGLIGVIDNSQGTIKIDNAFDSSSNYSISTIYDAEVEVTNSYYVNGTSAVQNGVINGNFTKTSIENLKNKDFVINNLLYSEYVDANDIKINNENIWVYEDDHLPILFLDDIKSPTANIHVSLYSWNNLSLELSKFRFESNITFSIEDANELVPNKEIYYYVSNSKIPLIKEELDQISSWVPYEDIIQITEEGVYVIYAKVVDYFDKVIYINTDLLVLDTPGLDGSIIGDSKEWQDYREDLEVIYTDRSNIFNVEFDDGVSEIPTIRYHISDIVLTLNELNKLKNHEWLEYDSGIVVDAIGSNIVYVQIIDDFDFVTYINTDIIILEGYEVNSLIIGRNDNSYLDEEPYITDKSLVSFNYTYSKENATELSDYTHNLMSSILFPIGTKINIIDNIKHKVYTYQIPTVDDYYNYNDSCELEDLDCKKVATYPFTLFKEVGAIDKYFIEDDYYNEGNILEDFTVNIDFIESNISNDYLEALMFLEMHDLSGNSIRPTIFNTLKNFNIVTGAEFASKLFLTTDYNDGEIMYNSNSTTAINISSGLNYKMFESHKIIDTTNEDKEIGLSIKLVDSEDNIVDKEHLKNIIFKIGENKFYPESDNLVRINLNEGINNVDAHVTIITNKTNNTLKPGTYYFKISNYISSDGHYYSNIGNDEITLPVNVSEDDYDVPYGFDVISDKNSHIINRKEEEVVITFDILQAGLLTNPNIRVSLYQKETFTAYDQKYLIVDLADYVSNSLDEYISNVYYVTTNPLRYTEENKIYNEFSLNLITNNFENNGYKFSFELYDGTKKIGTIDKYFIVK